MLLTSYHFCSSTEPSGTQVERDNPLYESQVLRPHTIVQVITSTSPVQHPSVMQSMCYIAVPFLPISAYLPLPGPSFISFLHSPYPLSSLPPSLSQELTIEMFQDDDDALTTSSQHLVPPPPLTTSTPAGGRESTYSGADDDELLAEALEEPQKEALDYNSETSLI